MANHLTPEELSKELGLDRQEVIRVCVEEGVPIYQGKIDKYLFQTQQQLAAQQPSSSLGSCTQPSGVRRTSSPASCETGSPPFEAAFPFLESFAVRRLCASATLWRSASIRSITGASATGSGATISWPASFASSICARSRR